MMRDADEQEVPPPWGLAWRLAIGQVVAWGVLFYSFAIVVGPMHDGTDWSRPFLNAGLSIGLLLWGICALPVGAWIQRRGGRELMAAASLIGGGGLIALGLVTNPIVYLCLWIPLGISMAALFYEPAFAVVTAAFGSHYRRGITLITLVAGFASTVFMPLAQLAVSTLGWRGAFMALGSLLIVVGVPIHLFGIPKHVRLAPLKADHRPVTHKVRHWFRELRRDITDRRFVGLAIWFTAHAATFSGITFLLVPMLQSESVGAGTYLIAIALIGPMQVLGRIVLASRGDRFSSLLVGRLALTSIALGVVCLLVLPHTLLGLCSFAILYGAGNGVMTIVRGTSIAEIFGRAHYAELNGALAMPIVFASALSPVTLAAAWASSGTSKAVVYLALVLLMVGGVGLVLAKRAVDSKHGTRSMHS